MSRRLHVLGVAHTVPHHDYLVCAFTAKIFLFPEVIKPFGWYVTEYSNEGSESKAHEHVVILTKERLAQLSRRKSRDDPHALDLDNTELGTEYQDILVRELKLRVKPGDIVCHVWGPNIGVYDATRECHHVEFSVGYDASPGLPFRVYESSAWMHYHYAKAGDGDGNNYKWVIPSAFNEEKWTPADTPGDYALFLGRVTGRKGINTLVEIARRMPHLPVHVYGPGDTSPWMADRPENLIFKGALFGDERIEIVRRARCMLMPTSYIEPFGFSGIEAQLCGVPLLGSSFGAFQETIIDGVTGFRCHTLADWTEAIRWSDTLDRGAIAQSARQRYSRPVVGQQYDWVFKQLADLSGPGWYGERSRKFEALAATRDGSPQSPKIWLFIPYFGRVPSFFHLYLDSLQTNGDCLRVILMTDIDLTDYNLPPNLICIPMTLPALRQKISRFLAAEFGQNLDPESLIATPYKLVDFKIMYPELFLELGTRYGIGETDYVGWGDIDVVYGRLADFLRLDGGFDIIGGFHGHFTAMRNTSLFRRLFREVPNLLELLQSSESHITDEIAYRQPLLDFIDRQNAKLFYINQYFCDVVPPCFVSLFRSNVPDPEDCFFDVYHPHEEIHEIRIHKDGRVVVVATNRHQREVAYCHFQKRPMRLAVQKDHSFIVARRDGFYSDSLPFDDRDGVLHEPVIAHDASPTVAAAELLGENA